MHVKLTENELNAALNFIEESGNSVFFPQPFEIAAIRFNWEYILPILKKIDLLSYRPDTAIRFFAPKQKYFIRPIHLLNPIDNILFTGLVYRLAPQIEEKRIQVSDDKIFSMRLKVNDQNGNFTFENDWEKFSQKLEEKSSKYEMVAKADIVDFFPRIYTHRLENSIDSISDMKYEKRSLKRFLDRWSDGTSYGIPVGPLASNILAEALLIQVDEFLISIDADFVRYIDDYYIFNNSESECIKVLNELGQRLDQEHLSLNMAKTRPMTTIDLVSELIKPTNPDLALRTKIITELFKGDPYAIVDYEKLSPEHKKLIDNVDVERMVEKALDSDLANFANIKFVLNVLSALRRPELVDIILENLDRLSPISDAVARFLNVFDEVGESDRLRIGQKILTYLQTAPYITDFQAIWLLQPFVQSKKWNHINDLRKIARDHKNYFVRTQAILAIGMSGDRSALLDVKPLLDSAHDWEWRAIIYACRNLPEDERDALYRHLKIENKWEKENLLQKATKEYGIHN